MIIRKTVLMIDDNTELLEIAKSLFPAKEFVLLTARDGAEGLLKIKNQKFDVIISDIKMPKMDGIKLIEEVRRNLKNETPILIYSAHLDDLPPTLQGFKKIFRLNKPSQGYELVQRVKSIAESGLKIATPVSNDQKNNWEANEYLFREGDSGNNVFIIESGKVGIYKEFSDGKEVLIETLEVGDVMGCLTPTEANFRFFTAKTLEKTILKFYSQEMLIKESAKTSDWFQKILLAQHARLLNSYQRMRTFIKAA